MSDSQSLSSAAKPKGSLWTTPASKAASAAATGQRLVDKRVTSDDIRRAVDATKDRAAAFSGHVSDEVLRASVE